MMKKKITQAVIAANRDNARKSSGPKTKSGKLATKRNAITHGYLAQELVLNDEERKQLEAQSLKFRSENPPQDVIQEVAFQEVIACVGRRKLALRAEMRAVSRIVSESEERTGQPDRLRESDTRFNWYLGSNQGLRQSMQLLADLRAEFLHLNRIDQKWHDPLDDTFGPEFRRLLTRWTPTNWTAALLAHHLVEHQQRYGGSLPMPQSPTSETDRQKTVKIVPDQMQGSEMVVKLIDLQSLLLNDLYKNRERRASESAKAQNGPADFAPRYFTTASRDLHRAVDWYMQLKQKISSQN
jgi:hypothetical protein